MSTSAPAAKCCCLGCQCRQDVSSFTVHSPPVFFSLSGHCWRGFPDCQSSDLVCSSSTPRTSNATIQTTTAFIPATTTLNIPTTTHLCKELPFLSLLSLKPFRCKYGILPAKNGLIHWFDPFSRYRCSHFGIRCH